MLRKEAVSESTLDVLKTLMKDRQLKDFFLVGGTALALQIGHRLSLDLDLFSQSSFNENEMLSHLEKCYLFQLDFQDKNTLKGSINGIKVDFITHNYPLVKPLISIDDLRMASPDDIAAMKLNAIIDNGTRLKDFIDISYLSSTITLSQMIDAYAGKYSSRNPAIAIKALDYQNDIDFNEPIQILNGNYSWEEVRKRLSEMTLKPDKLFQNMRMHHGK